MLLFASNAQFECDADVRTPQGTPTLNFARRFGLHAWIHSLHLKLHIRSSRFCVSDSDLSTSIVLKRLLYLTDERRTIVGMALMSCLTLISPCYGLLAAWYLKPRAFYDQWKRTTLIEERMKRGEWCFPPHNETSFPSPTSFGWKVDKYIDNQRMFLERQQLWSTLTFVASAYSCYRLHKLNTTPSPWTPFDVKRITRTYVPRRGTMRYVLVPAAIQALGQYFFMNSSTSQNAYISKQSLLIHRDYPRFMAPAVSHSSSR